MSLKGTVTRLRLDVLTQIEMNGVVVCPHVMWEDDVGRGDDCRKRLHRNRPCLGLSGLGRSGGGNTISTCLLSFRRVLDSLVRIEHLVSLL